MGPFSVPVATGIIRRGSTGQEVSIRATKGHKPPAPRTLAPHTVKSNFLSVRARVDKAAAKATDTAKALTEAKTALDNYKNLLRQGEY